MKIVHQVDGKSPTGRRTYGVDDKAVQLMFYNTFEVLDLPCSGPMEFYKNSSRCEVVLALSVAHPLCGPCLKCAGASALVPLFSGNSNPTIPHCFHNLQRSKFPYCCADLTKESGRKGSNVYEVNQWLWYFGRGKPRLGGLSVYETEVLRMAVMQVIARRG